jgi:hypothetical protein
MILRLGTLLGPLDAIWHLLNFFGPAFGVGCLGAVIAKLIWRAELRTRSVIRLAAWSTGAAALGLVVALVVFGRDGRVWGYAVLLACAALGLWWAAFGARSP